VTTFKKNSGRGKKDRSSKKKPRSGSFRKRPPASKVGPMSEGRGPSRGGKDRGGKLGIEHKEGDMKKLFRGCVGKFEMGSIRKARRKKRNEKTQTHLRERRMRLKK